MKSCWVSVCAVLAVASSVQTTYTFYCKYQDFSHRLHVLLLAPLLRFNRNIMKNGNFSSKFRLN